jgi:hypothetical protein
MKTPAILVSLLTFVALATSADLARAVDLSQIERSIAKEPAYRNEPHYGLLVFGPQAAQRSWLVMDGNEILYFDRNRNGDLTDPEDRIELDAEATKKIRISGEGYSGLSIFEIGTVAGVKLRFQFWVRKRDFTPNDEWLRNLLQEREANHWENSTLLRIAADGTQAQIPILLTAKPVDAQIAHLDCPLTIGLRSAERQKLQPWPQSTNFDVQIGTPMLPPRNYARPMFAPLATGELPKDVHPQAVFTYPAKKPGAPPIVQIIELNQRCCGDSLFAPMTVPREAGEGMAQVSISYAPGPERVILPATFEVPIGGQRRSLDSETSYVMFSNRDGTVGLDEALVALRVAGFNVRKMARPEMTSLLIEVDDRPVFAITLNRKPEVRNVARALAENSTFATALNDCNARFEVYRFPDKSDFKEMELSNIHRALLQETGGIVYTPWDKRLFRAE